MMVRMCHVAVASVLVLFATVGDVLSAPAHVSGPSPANGATAVATASTVLSWIATDATGYDIAFGPVSPPPLVAHQPAAQFNPGALAPSTTYFWQVTARGPGGPGTGPIWSFTTAGSTGTGTSLRRLKLLTWNIQHGLDAGGAEAVDEQVALMVDSNADVIGLQEVSIEAGKDLSTLYKRKLEAATGETWYSVWAPVPRAPIYTPEGNLILTRLPIVSSATTAWDTIPQWPDVIGAKRAAAQVELLVNNRPVNVIVTHLDTAVATRRQQLGLLLQWARRFSGPTILGGDLNMMPGEPDHAVMTAQLPDAWTTLVDRYQSTPEAGYTLDVRSIAPWTGQPGRVDYWFVDPANAPLAPTEISVLKTRRSDHNALLMWVDVR